MKSKRKKQKMKEIADCFVCLPGSYGTLDEMIEKMKKFDRPMVLFQL